MAKYGKISEQWDYIVPDKYKNFKVKGNGEIVFYDEDIIIEDYTNSKEVKLKYNGVNLLIRTLYKFAAQNTLKYLDDDLDIVIAEKSNIAKVLKILSSNTEFYDEIRKDIEDEYEVY